jgi:hypothetical protein
MLNSKSGLRFAQAAFFAATVAQEALKVRCRHNRALAPHMPCQSKARPDAFGYAPIIFPPGQNMRRTPSCRHFALAGRRGHIDLA